MKEKSVIGLGFLLVIMPLIGIPREWKIVCTVLIGVVFLYLGALFYRVARMRELAKREDEIRTQTFTETA